MFRECKIATGISILTGVFIILLVAMSSYSIVNSFATSRSFNDMMEAVKDRATLRTVITYLDSSASRTNALMLNKMVGRQVNGSDLAEVQGLLSEVKTSLDAFMKRPFTTAEEKEKAIEISELFENAVENEAQKIGYISDPASYPNDLGADSRNLLMLRDKVNEFNDISRALQQGYANEANNAAKWMMVMAVVMLCLAFIGFLLSRVWLKRTVFNRLDQAKEALQTIATGNLSQEIEIGARNEIGLMLAELEKMRQSLTKTVCGIRSGVNNIYSNAREIASSNNDLSSRTEEQASALQQTAASMEELKITVRQNADNAR
ncbi:MAG: HAMP domain-containing protein, partial [Enterobacteriaceae bacterium]|nr:HAMP domain-containing protein [Enterobacteriaceae bacterium]